MGGLQTAAYAVGLQDHRQMLRDAAYRTKESFKAQMKAAGHQPTPESETDDMGDIFVTGDIMQHQQTQAADTSGMSDLLKKLITAGAFAGLGAGGAVVADKLLDDKPAATSPAPVGLGSPGYRLEIETIDD